MEAVEIDDPSTAGTSVPGNYPVTKAFVSLLGLALAFFLPAWWLLPATSNASPQLADLTDATIAEIRSAGGAVMMSGEFRSRVDSVGNVEKDAALFGSQRERVIGEIEIEIPREGAADPRQELEVDVISLPPRSTYYVYINDRAVATFATDDRGSVDMEFLSALPKGL